LKATAIERNGSEEVCFNFAKSFSIICFVRPTGDGSVAELLLAYRQGKYGEVLAAVDRQQARYELDRVTGAILPLGMIASPWQLLANYLPSFPGQVQWPGYAENILAVMALYHLNGRMGRNPSSDHPRCYSLKRYRAKPPGRGERPFGPTGDSATAPTGRSLGEHVPRSRFRPR
jgi:hypothetical protein